jgi:hypothetical protein
MKPTELKTSTVVRWFQTLNIQKQMVPVEQFSRLLECFWESQLRSKLWLIDTLKDAYLIEHIANTLTYVYGGWYGTLGQMLYDEKSTMVVSIDIDPECERNGKLFAPDVVFLTENMTTHVPNSHCVSINTSSEHITQEEYDLWWDNRPPSQLVIVQGNNLFDNAEHVRCHHNLQDFVMGSRMQNIVWSGELVLKDFTRFMVIGFR